MKETNGHEIKGSQRPSYSLGQPSPPMDVLSNEGFYQTVGFNSLLGHQWSRNREIPLN